MSDSVEPAAPQPDPALEAAAVGDPDSPQTGEPPLAEGEAAPRRRHPFYLRGRRPRLPRSRRGLFALLLVLGGLGGVAVFSTVSLINWTETADFCGRCHTMSPELQAYHAGPHKSVACAECHVEPGVMGWIKAKINGTKQLIDVVIGSYPTPIPPPDHADMPPASETCEACHGVTRTAVNDLKTETVYGEDQANTPQFVGLMIRPTGGDPFDVSRSVHWHVLQKVTFQSTDVRSQTIDEVEVTQKDGSVDTYIAQAKIKNRGDVGPDIATIKATEPQTTMSCYDCHNRVGHDIANPRTGLDQAMTTGASSPTAAGAIDPTLPYIKREAMKILWAGYPDDASADAAAGKLHEFYALNYPQIAQTKAVEIDEAITEIKTLYRLTATPEMKVTATTYPNNLGHLDYPGCFRCHDGAHYKVVDGKVTKQVIPSTCDTCHTFPQIGTIASVPLGQPPKTHDDTLWVFNHKNVATSVDPGGQSCGNCHAKDYCVNCHSTGAVTVDHDAMATNHAAVIRTQGNTACAYCHQPVFCATCHGSNQVLPVTTPFSTQPHPIPLPSPSGSPGIPPQSPSPSNPGTTSVLFPLRGTGGG